MSGKPHNFKSNEKSGRSYHHLKWLLTGLSAVLTTGLVLFLNDQL